MNNIISIIIPLLNEEKNVPILVDRLIKVLDSENLNFQIVLVDDGSRDGSYSAIMEASRNDRRVEGIRFSRNFGQATAIKAGVEYARGDVCITMDGDLQHDPVHIPDFLEKINEGHDLVCGYRFRRNDGLVRRIPSKIANFLARKFSGLNISDFGSTYRAYNTRVIREISIYGEMHRFIPIFVSALTNRITEIPIHLGDRIHGKSKYGIGRTFRVFSDIVSLIFFTSFFNRPIHIFGYLSLFLGLPGLCILGWLSLGKIFGGIFIMDYLPMFFLGVMLCLVAGQIFTTGIVCEYLLRVYYKKENVQPYHVMETTFDKKLEG